MYFNKNDIWINSNKMKVEKWKNYLCMYVMTISNNKKYGNLWNIFKICNIRFWDSTLFTTLTQQSLSDHPYIKQEYCTYVVKNSTLHRHWTENWNKIFSERKLCGRSPNFLISTFKYLWAIYLFPPTVCLFGCSKISRPIVGIYKSLTDVWL